MDRAVIAASKPVEEASDVGHDSGWKTVLFNCECHSFDQVERILIKAVGCGIAQARAYSWEVHSKGSAVVYRGARQRCEAVAEIIASVGLLVKAVQ